ncbi:MAG: type II and III secretion system protein, partial [Aquificae bacterium]|nr:type II and III secretion system protein [Aquificota bacterium]
LSFNANGDRAGLLTFKLSNAKLNALEFWLRAYERENKARSLAEPYVDTLNGEPALIASGLEWPITRLTYSQTTTNVTWQYKTIPLILQATPLVLPDGNILLDISLARKQIVEVLRVPVTQDLTQDIPVISASRIEIKLPVKEGETVVIGGIVERNTSLGEEGVPGLRRIPLLGWLFKTQTKELRDRELLIFLTPQIVEE